MITTDLFTKWLEQFINFEREPKKDLLNLEKMRFFANEFGEAHKTFKTIHVAGSKGKGSVSTMLSFCLTEAGFKTGLYTSPHVLDFRERVSLAGEFFSDVAYSKAYSEVMAVFENLLCKNPELEPTWFEIVTCLSFVLFRNEKLDYAVYEVGMGGRLDTTNIISPEACAIMPIELEHCKYLGNTIEQIAFEKAGIIKPEIPVFCFEQEAEALDVLKKTSSEKNARLFYMPKILESIEKKVSLEGLNVKISYKAESEIGRLFSRPLSTKLKLLDEVQAKNASLVVALLKYILPKEMSEEVLEKGLSKTWLPGRFELMSKKPLVIIDGAHTITSLKLSVSTFEKVVNKKAILLFACAEDKDMEHIPSIFEKTFEKIYLTIPGLFKKSNLARLEKAFKNYYAGKNHKLEISTDYQAQIQKAYDEAKKLDMPLLITGSFYLVGEAKGKLKFLE
ncbi:MAG: bifunctional folylpolyglutamate synthase/dihydrofolate synthase [Treponemataceae bacterium]